MKEQLSPKSLYSKKVKTQRRIDNKKILTFLLLCCFLLSLLAVDWSNGVFRPQGISGAVEIFQAAFKPDLNINFLLITVFAAWKTVAYAVAGLSVALLLGCPLGLISSGTLAQGKLGSWSSIVVVRFILAFLRSIHELVWALIFLAAIGLSPIAAVLALGIPYGGILGRIFSELLQDVPEEPLNSLRSAGASEFRVFLYGRLPMALPEMLSYTFYRLECGIRSAAVLSWVGIGGLGFQIQIALSDLAYGRMWTSLWALIILVLLVDLWSREMRKRISYGS